MRRWVGRWLLGVAALHTFVGLVAFAAPLRALLAPGAVDVLGAGDPRRALAFWFLVSGVLTALVGYLTDRLERATGGPLPAALGWALLLLGVGGGVLAPVSGFWLVLPAAVGALRRARGAAYRPPAS
jgi:hypothetical protein